MLFLWLGALLILIRQMRLLIRSLHFCCAQVVTLVSVAIFGAHLVFIKRITLLIRQLRLIPSHANIKIKVIFFVLVFVVQQVSIRDQLLSFEFLSLVLRNLPLLPSLVTFFLFLNLFFIVFFCFPFIFIGGIILLFTAYFDQLILKGKHSLS